MNDDKELPDYYTHVAGDIMRLCDPRPGIWIDLGCGAGPLALALADLSDSVIVMVDPNGSALQDGLRKAAQRGMAGRVVSICAPAEAMPLADESVDLVISRGSIFFWKDRPAGLREIYRVLRPGGKAMIGGGLGSTYPPWARRKFIAQRRAGQEENARRAFREVRSHETFSNWASQAGVPRFDVIGEGGLSEDDPDTGLGVWLLFDKEVCQQ